MKTYIGNKDGENCYIEWKLKDGKFSASGYYEDTAGYDHTQGGQILDTIVADFHESTQAQRIHKVWKDWHLNDMVAGSPRQMELLQDVIRPEYEELKARVQEQYNSYDKALKDLIHQCEKKKFNSHHRATAIAGNIIEDIKTRDFDGNKRGMLSYTLMEQQQVKRGFSSPSSGGYRSVSLRYDNAFILKQGTAKLPDHYAYIKSRLQDLGRLHDPDYIVEGKAYQYGTKWLTVDLPEDVVEEINSWEEVPFTGKTLLEGVIEENNCNLQHRCFDSDRGQNHFVLEINNVCFDFWAGTGIEVDSVTPEQVLGCVLEDARSGCDGFDMALDYCYDMGYENREADKVAQLLVDQFEKVVEAGLWTGEVKDLYEY